jgi:hypothetical protein
MIPGLQTPALPGAPPLGRRPARRPPLARWLPALLALSLALPVLTALPMGALAADDPQAREIMRKVQARDDGDNQTAEVHMVLIDSKNNRRVRELKSFRKDKGEDTLSILFFVSPADVKGTGFLTYDYEESGKDDDQWLFLPALRKSKRIAASDKSGSFMGSDFNYSDMTDPDLEEYDYTLVKEEEVGGHPTWQIQALPRAANWVYKSPRLKFMQVNKLEQIDGIWTATELQMVTREGNATVHATILQFNGVRFGQSLTEELFTVRQLEKGL